MNPSGEQGALPADGREPLAESKKQILPPEPPGKKEGHRVRNLIFIILLIIALGETAYIFRGQLKGSGKSGSQAITETDKRKVLYYQCSMHPDVKSDKPGKCPICGMDLNPIYAEESAPATKSGERKVLYWQDPMNPQNHYDKPGKAPDGMDLVPVYAEETGTESARPEGAFKVTPEKQQLIGVQYGEATLQSLTKTIRAVATLTYDETKIARVHAKIEGWIDKVFVDFTGQLVKKGQPLLTIYSPELVATQEEYLLALRAKDKLGNSSFTEVADGANSLLDAARKRLELWDISDEQIAEVEKTKKPIKALLLYSPVSGFVTARNAYENQRITPDTELYAIADLSTVWAIADFFEYEIRDIRLGQMVMLTIDSFPGRTFRGKVTYIYPQLDNTTRTLRVRAEFPNPDFTLKPDMYANANLKIEYGQMLAIPQEAVLDSGAEQLVFVALDGGYFEPRKVVLGDKVDNRMIVLSGLKAGERVVTSGNFLVDSESKLKSAASGMGMPGMDYGAASGQKSKKSSDAPVPQSAPMDNSNRQRQKKDELPVPSNHSTMPGMNNHD
jgi:membrane fusion protein, copper/silver efflux system